nr:polysaccharide pyruvyl transferase family protein [uncultured Eisenbergiella sp.]
MVSIKKILPMEVNLELKNITEYLKLANLDVPKTSKSRAFLLDAASYNNLGDQAITYAIYLFLRDLFGEDCYFEISEKDLLRNLKYLKKVIHTEDVLCLNGGGNMGNLYPRYEALRRKVIKSFPNNKIVIFPQTIDYESDSYGKRELERSRKIYNRHEHLVVCAREKNSLECMKKYYRNVVLVPDIVFYLKGRIIWESSERKDCIGVCLRDDKESAISSEQKNNICSAIKETGLMMENLTTMSDSCQLYTNSEYRREALRKKLQEFNSYKCIITDRLHGMIFSILAGVPCLAIDNSNKKVSGVLSVIDNVHSAKIIDVNTLESLSSDMKCLRNGVYEEEIDIVDVCNLYSSLKNLIL